MAHQRKECGLLASEANNDTLAKGAVINFIDAMEWLDEFQPPTRQKLLYNLFPPKSSQDDDNWAKETKNLVKKLCSGTTDTNGKEKWEKLIHDNYREIERKRFFTEWKEKPEDESTDDENENESSSQLNSPKQSNERKIIRQLLNENRNTYQRSKPRQPKSPYELWLDMEKYAQANEKAFQLNSPSQAEKEDRLLSDQVFFWLVETFSRLLGTPFSVMLEQSKKNRAEAKLQASFEKESSHDLAEEIENRLIHDDDEDVTIKKSELKKLITAEADKIFTRKLKQAARKKSSREAAVTSQRNTSDGTSGNEKITKTKRTVRFSEPESKNKKAKNQPYLKQTNTRQKK